MSNNAEQTFTGAKSKQSLIHARELFSAGKILEAKHTIETVLLQEPENLDALFLLGGLAGQLNEFDKAIVLLEKLLTLNPSFIAAYNNLALAYEFSGDWDKAVSTYQTAIELSDTTPELLNNLGDLYRKMGKWDLALQQFNIALDKNPTNENTLLNIANVYSEQKKYQQAEDILKNLVNNHTQNPKVYNNYAGLCNLLERSEDAENFSRKALSLNPNYPQALSNLGIALVRESNFSEAETVLNKAIQIMPTLVDAYINLGFLYHNIGQFDKALTTYNKAIELDPKNDFPRWYRSFSNLLLGNFEQAWKDYEYGFTCGDRLVRNLSFPTWHPQGNFSDDLLVIAEQGVGDQIMFASCLQDLQKNHKHIILECERRLKPLFKRSFPNITVVGTKQNKEINWISNYPNISSQIAIGSLPYFFRNDFSEFPNQQSYLSADQDAVQKWQARYEKLGPGYKIGISWRAGNKVETKKRSSELLSWLPLLKTKNCYFINLQYGNHKDEIDQFQQETGIQIHDWDDSDSMQNIDDFAAQIKALDLVISMGNTNVHLAGSLGVPAWCIIPYVPSWRWLFQGSRSPWYQSVKIYRQATMNNWTDTIKTVSNDLQSITSSKTEF